MPSLPQFEIRIDMMFMNGELKTGEYRRLICVLADAGADLNLNGLDAACYISTAMSNDWFFKYYLENLHVIREILAALIEIGVDIHQHDMFGRTPSMNTRRASCWTEWKEALLENDMSIDEVIAAEGNHWLLNSNWQDTWDEKCLGPLTLDALELSDRLEWEEDDSDEATDYFEEESCESSGYSSDGESEREEDYENLIGCKDVDDGRDSDLPCGSEDGEDDSCIACMCHSLIGSPDLRRSRDDAANE
jgi:hypothetical protein